MRLARYWFLKGRLLEKFGETERAIAAYSQTLALDRNQFKAAFAKGGLESLVGNYD